MTASTLDSFATVRSLDEAQAETDQRESLERALAEEFIRAARRGDMDAWLLTTGKPQKFGDVFVEVMQYEHFDKEMAAVVCHAAMGLDREDEAAALIHRMAACWANQNSY